MFSTGEGAVSTGAMVPVFDARDSGSATAVAALLESHAIPAIIDSELAGPTGLRHGETPRVYVPSTMLPAAKAILQKRKAPPKPAPDQVSTPLDWVPARVVTTQSALDVRPPPAPVVAPPTVADVPEDEDDDLPLERPLPDPGPLAPRLIIALVAIAFGLALQRGVELALGTRGAALALGASVEILEAPWRLVTAGFMHGSLGHMLSNATFGLMIGVVLFGTHRIGATCAVWVLTSMAGIGAELYMSPGSLVIGASAGNYGLVGLWAAGQLQRAKVVPLPRREVLRTIGILLLLVPGAFTPFSSSGTKIAVAAHGFGFLAGLVLGKVFRRRLDDDHARRIDTVALGTGVAAVVFTVGATALALLDTVS